MTCTVETENLKVVSIPDGHLGLELRLIKANSRPLHLQQKACDTLVLFFGWLNAGENGLKDYFELYETRKLDVLFVPGRLKYFAWPPTCETFCLSLLDILCNNETFSAYKYFLFHGVSIGCYEFTNCLMLANSHKKKYDSFLKKLKGTIFDSATYGSYIRMKKGMANGLTKNRVLRNIIPNVLSVYFFFTWQYTGKVFEKMMYYLEEMPHDALSLFLYSRNDPMSDPDVITKVADGWKHKLQNPVLRKCWDKSTHAAHLRNHRNEYLAIHDQFLELYWKGLNENDCKTPLKSNL